MTNLAPTQEAADIPTDSWKWGQPTTGYPTRRPDGTIVKVPILDPNDPGMADRDGTLLVKRRAKNGSAALLEALERMRRA